MNELINFIKKYKVFFVFSLLLITCLLLINANINNRAGTFRSFVIVSVSNLQKYLPLSLNPGVTQNINQELRQLNLELYSDVVHAKSAIKEYNKFKKMVDFQEQEETPTIVCKIIGKSLIETRTYLSIDKGKLEGVKRGMAVRTDAGLVGTITGVSNNYSICESIVNKNVKISVKTQRTNAQGILNWKGGENLIIEKISNDFDVQTGDIVFTSNMSNKYPADIPVGQIILVNENSGSYFYDISLEPFVDINKIEFLFVVAQLPDPERVNLLENIEQNLKNRNSK